MDKDKRNKYIKYSLVGLSLLTATSLTYYLLKKKRKKKCEDCENVTHTGFLEQYMLRKPR